jgi:hypothetical protein
VRSIHSAPALLLTLCLLMASIPLAFADDPRGSCSDELRDPDGRCPRPNGCSETIPRAQCVEGHWHEDWDCCTARIPPAKPKARQVERGEVAPKAPSPPPGPELSAFEKAESSFLAFVALGIDGPGDRKLSRRETDKLLARQLETKALALQVFEGEVSTIIAEGDDPVAITALSLLGRAYLNMAGALEKSYIPAYLNEDQVELYKMALDDKIQPQYAKSVEAFSMSLDRIHQARWYEPLADEVVAWLCTLDPENHQEIWEQVPEPPSSRAGTSRSGTSQDALIAIRYHDFRRAQALLDSIPPGEESIETSLAKAIVLRAQGHDTEVKKLYSELMQKARQGALSEEHLQLVYFNAATFYEKYRGSYSRANKILAEFIDLHDGELNPDHPVYQRMDRVRQTQERAEVEAVERQRREQEQRAREQRWQDEFERLIVRTTKLDAIVERYADCPAMVEMGMTEMGLVVLEQAKMVLDADDYAMAGDMLMFFDQVEPEIEAIIPSCE